MARLKDEATSDLLVGGPQLAAQAPLAGLVDELVLFVWPIILGGRNSALSAGAHLDLDLVDEHRFRNGVIRLRYRVLAPPSATEVTAAAPRRPPRPQPRH